MSADTPENDAFIDDTNRVTNDPMVAALLTFGHPEAPAFLRRWQDRGVVEWRADRILLYSDDAGGLREIDGGMTVTGLTGRDVSPIRPNAGVRAVVAAALVPFELSDADPDRRRRGCSFGHHPSDRALSGGRPDP
jgi:urea transport system permease protein